MRQRLSFTFTIRPDAIGWADAQISDGRNRADLRDISHITDALGNLLGAVCGLIDGGTSNRLMWEREPEGWRWVFRQEAGQVHLKILDFEDSGLGEGWQPDETGRAVFETTVPLTVLATAIADGAEAARGGCSQDTWDYQFPATALAGIRQWLARAA